MPKREARDIYPIEDACPSCGDDTYVDCSVKQGLYQVRRRICCAVCGGEFKQTVPLRKRPSEFSALPTTG